MPALPLFTELWPQVIFFVDRDGDGFGDSRTNTSQIQTMFTFADCPNSSLIFTGFANNNIDCNDADASVNISGAEICDGKDNDCNGRIDDGPWAAAAATSIGESISYQVHSWNDVREWPAAFRKGLAHFKIDAHWASASFCQGQLNVNTSDSRGCVLLSHDLPVSSVNDYNSSVDVVTFLNDSRCDWLFRLLVRL